MPIFLYLYICETIAENEIKIVVMNILPFSFCFTVRRPFHQVKGVQFKWVRKTWEGESQTFIYVVGWNSNPILQNITKTSRDNIYIRGFRRFSRLFRQFIKKKKVSPPLTYPTKKNLRVILFFYICGSNGRDQWTWFLFFAEFAGKFENHRSSVNPKLGRARQ